MSDNWVVQNLENALETWNEKLSEIWTLITTTPQNFKGGNIWKVIVDINGAVQAIGLALLVLFFVIGMVKTALRGRNPPRRPWPYAGRRAVLLAGRDRRGTARRR